MARCWPGKDVTHLGAPTAVCRLMEALGQVSGARLLDKTNINAKNTGESPGHHRCQDKDQKLKCVVSQTRSGNTESRIDGKKARDRNWEISQPNPGPRVEVRNRSRALG